MGQAAHATLDGAGKTFSAWRVRAMRMAPLFPDSIHVLDRWDSLKIRHAAPLLADARSRAIVLDCAGIAPRAPLRDTSCHIKASVHVLKEWSA